MTSSISDNEFEDFPETLQTLFHQMAAAAVDFIFLRENPLLIAGDTDLDVWCPADDQKKMLRVMVQCGWYLVSGRYHENCDGKSWVYRFRHQDAGPVLEFWAGDLRADAFFYMKETRLLEIYKEGKKEHFLPDNGYLDILILRTLLKHRPMKKYIRRVRALHISSDEKSDWLVKIQTAFGNGIAGRCQEVLAGLDSKIAWSSLACLLIRQHTAVQAAGLMRKKIHAMWCMWARRSRIVSFVGTDGSGKTYWANMLKQFVEKSSKQRVSLIYAGRSRENSFFVRLVRKIILNLFSIPRITPESWKQNRNDSPQTPAHQDSGKMKWLKFFALWIYFAEFYYRYAGLRIKSFFTRKVYVLDRGAWDIATMPGMGALPKKLAGYGPKSDITFFCHAAPDIILARKKERTRAEIKRQQHIFDQLGKSAKTLFVKIDTGLSETLCRQKLSVYYALMQARKLALIDSEICRKYLETYHEISEK